MVFCSLCQGAIPQQINNGEIILKCQCGYVQETTDEDVLIQFDTKAVTSITELYDLFISYSSHDPTITRVHRVCKCGLDYMTQLRIGHNAITVWTCKCGIVEYNNNK